MKPRGVLLLTMLAPGRALASAPLNYLTSSGASTDPVTLLTWGLLLISVAVVVIISVLVARGVSRQKPWLRREKTADVPVTREGDGLRWITIGVALSAVALVATLIWTVGTLAMVSQPPREPPLTIRVVGHQWWWQAVYEGPTPDSRIEVANEIHIPVGQPVRIKLESQDVIHSFWVPQLAGKTDAIPGRTNLAWIQADKPGVYLGQCTEYCGKQHAHMAFRVIAERPDQFRVWWARQLLPAAPPLDPIALQGAVVFVNHCGACHTVRGTLAGGSVAPDLTHLMSRTTLAAGMVPNTPANLSGWIANPQGVKPGTLMPTTYLSGPELTAVRRYLETLR
ncbi:MAG TPA: cytochrome c oxidase subunit II [Caulobacteraceae bacterium]